MDCACFRLCPPEVIGVREEPIAVTVVAADDDAVAGNVIATVAMDDGDVADTGEDKPALVEPEVRVPGIKRCSLNSIREQRALEAAETADKLAAVTLVAVMATEEADVAIADPDPFEYEEGDKPVKSDLSAGDKLREAGPTFISPNKRPMMIVQRWIRKST
jgi:hypothetical protein